MTASQHGLSALSVQALGRAALVYALGGFAYKGVAILAVPLLARLLSPAELGLLDLAAVMASILGLSAVMGGEQAVAYLESRVTDRARLWGSSLAMLLVIGGGLAIGMIVLRAPLAQLVTGNAANGALVVAAACYGIVVGLTAMTLNAVRLHGTARAYAASSFAIVTAEMTVALAVAWIVRDPVVPMVIAWAAAAAVVAVPILRRNVPSIGRPDVAMVRRLVSYGAPLVPATILWLVGDAVIRASLARAGDLGALGEYGIASRVTSVIGLAVAGFGVAWHPYIYRSPGSEVPGRAARMLGYVVLSVGVFAVPLSSLAPEVVAVVAGSAYAGASAALPALTAGMAALGVFVLTSAVVSASGSTGWIAIAVLAGVAVQVIVVQAMGSGLMLIGAAIASAAGYLAAAAVLLVKARHLLRGRSGVGALSTASFVSVGLIGASQMSSSPLELRIGFVLAYVAGTAVVGLVLNRLLPQSRIVDG